MDSRHSRGEGRARKFCAARRSRSSAVARSAWAKTSARPCPASARVFDVGSNPAHPTLIRTIADLPQKTSLVGPHTFYALPGRMLIGTLSNTKDKGGVTGLAAGRVERNRFARLEWIRVR